MGAERNDWFLIDTVALKILLYKWMEFDQASFRRKALASKFSISWRGFEWVNLRRKLLNPKVFIPLFGMLVVLLVFVFNRSPQTPDEEIPITSFSEKCEKEGSKDGWCLYENAKLGFSLEYPEEWEGTDFVIEPFEDGMSFTLSFLHGTGFPKFYSYTINWPSTTSAWEKFGSYTRNKDGSYNYHSLDGSIAATFAPTEVVESTDTEILIVGDENALELDSILSRGELDTNQVIRYAFINHETTYQGDTVRGVKFTYNKIPTETEKEKFDTMVSSFKKYQSTDGSEYEVNVPADFEFQEFISGGGGTSVVFVEDKSSGGGGGGGSTDGGPPDDGTVPGTTNLVRGGKIWIDTSGYTAGTSLGIIASAWATNGNFEASSPTNTTVSGTGAVALDFESTNISGKIVFFVHNGRLYQIGLAIYDFRSFSLPEIERYVGVFNELVSSFTLLGAGGGSPGTINVQPIGPN